MNKDEHTHQREFLLYELLQQATLDDSILVKEERCRMNSSGNCKTRIGTANI